MGGFESEGGDAVEASPGVDSVEDCGLEYGELKSSKETYLAEDCDEDGGLKLGDCGLGIWEWQLGGLKLKIQYY